MSYDDVERPFSFIQILQCIHFPLSYISTEVGNNLTFNMLQLISFMSATTFYPKRMSSVQ